METVERRTEESVIGIDGCNIKPARCEWAFFVVSKIKVVRKYVEDRYL